MATTWSHQAGERQALSALAATRRHEQLVLQIVLGPRRIPMAVPTNSPSSVARPLWQTLWYGNGATLDGEKRTALREKVSEHGFACTIRIGSLAGSRERERALLLNLLAALRTAETGGIRLRLRHERSRQLNESRSPWIWPLRLNVLEVLCLSGLAVGNEDHLPGIPAGHPRLLRALPSVKPHDRVLIQSTAPGDERPLGLSAKDALHHTHLIGVTGAGKSTLILNAIIADLKAGRSVVAVDPKGDLVSDILDHVPTSWRGDTVVLNPADDAVVGMNPLSPLNNDFELAADGVMAVFKGLYPDAIGPRTTDVLHAGLLTLGRRADTSLIMLPLLFTDDGFRRSITSTINDPVALGPFWAWFDSLSEAGRQQSIAPVLSRLRALVMRPALRAVLGQVQPRFDMQQLLLPTNLLQYRLRRVDSAKTPRSCWGRSSFHVSGKRS